MIPIKVKVGRVTYLVSMDTQIDAAEKGTATREDRLLAIVGELASELRPQHARLSGLSLSSRIEKDLGIDSLGRTELILRLEQGFGVRLPIKLVGEAETIGDLVAALDQSETSGARRGKGATIIPSAPVSAPTEARTLIDVLDWHVSRNPERVHVTVMEDDETTTAALAYGELATMSRAIAAGLIARDVIPGDRVALMLPTGVDFFASFFGILYAGAVPVPIYPPLQRSQIEDYAIRQAGILRNAGARMLITVRAGLRLGSLLGGLVPSLVSVESTENLALPSEDAYSPGGTSEAATALIQYTSGSTGDPKGVVLSHANLLANIRAIGDAIGASSKDVLVSWLPLYHDMGLIGAWLGSLYFGAPFYVMSPLNFLSRPQNWLWTIHRYRGTITAGPNFAFEMCLSKIDDAALRGLNLDSLRFVANGAEPVSVETLRHFTARFSRYGFRPDAMAPVYGLAENAVAVTLPTPGRVPVIDRIKRGPLTEKGLAEPASGSETNFIELVGCGHPVPGHEIRIVDDNGRELGERWEGRLEFRGPSATSGYFENPIKTRDLFHDGWLDTGDRGYVAAGDLFITGRVKDIIIRAGQHIAPHEIEEVVGSIPGIRRNAVAAFGISDPSAGTERVVILAETDEHLPSVRGRLKEEAQRAATSIVGGPPDEVMLVAPGTVPKTASGKIRRAAARELYLGGQLTSRQHAVWWQITRLSLAGARLRLMRFRRDTDEILYAAWWWLVVAIGCALGGLAVMILPRLSWRWAAIRSLARAILTGVGASLSVTGIERIPRGGAVLTFNHSSYIDALVLSATIPGEPAYVAKAELARQLVAGLLLRRLGVLFIDRFDLARSQSDLDKVIAVGREGRLLVFFPEGTFTRRTGLSGFYLGAFQAATQSGLPVLPSVLCGTRSMLRSNQWFPRRAAISVSIGEPLQPSGTDLTAIVRLRDRARAIMLAECGEPDLVELVKPTRIPGETSMG